MVTNENQIENKCCHENPGKIKNGPKIQSYFKENNNQ